MKFRPRNLTIHHYSSNLKHLKFIAYRRGFLDLLVAPAEHRAEMSSYSGECKNHGISPSSHFNHGFQKKNHFNHGHCQSNILISFSLVQCLLTPCQSCLKRRERWYRVYTVWRVLFPLDTFFSRSNCTIICNISKSADFVSEVLLLPEY
jgi:hypothetical protein